MHLIDSYQKPAGLLRRCSMVLPTRVELVSIGYQPIALAIELRKEYVGES